LKPILAELEPLISKKDRRQLTSEERIKQSANHFRERPFSRKDYLNQFDELSSATASRDLKRGVDFGFRQKQDDKATTKYLFKLNKEKGRYE